MRRRNSAKANQGLHPRTDFEELVHWDAFPTEIHTAIQSAVDRLALTTDPFEIGGLAG